MRESLPKEPTQRQFIDVAGPLFAVVVSPAASNVALNDRRKFRAMTRDRSRRRVIEDLAFAWQILEGDGSLSAHVDQETEFNAPATPGLVSLALSLRRRKKPWPLA